MATSQAVANTMKRKWSSLGVIDADDLGVIDTLIANDPEFAGRLLKFIETLHSKITKPDIIDCVDDEILFHYTADSVYVHIIPNPDRECPPFIIQRFFGNDCRSTVEYHTNAEIAANVLSELLISLKS